MNNGKLPVKPTDKGAKGMNPNTMQRRPNVAKPSPPKNFNLFRPQGK